MEVRIVYIEETDGKESLSKKRKWKIFKKNKKSAWQTKLNMYNAVIVSKETQLLEK